MLQGNNFRGIDFLVLLKEIFVQVLIFMDFTTKVTVTGIFLINATPYVRWHLLEGAHNIFKIKLGVYYRGCSKESGLLLEDLLCHI